MDASPFVHIKKGPDCANPTQVARYLLEEGKAPLAGQDFDTETTMSLIDPIQLMNLFGTAPQRKTRAQEQPQRFQVHMNRALDGRQTPAQTPRLGGGSGLDDSLIHSALNGLADLMRQSQPDARNASAARTASAERTASALGPEPAPELRPAPEPAAPPAIGEISAAFESGSRGVGAIGYDRNGGTSYGTYQIASRPGTMKRFISFLKEREPQWAAALQAAGPANTGSTRGKMPQVWRDIADAEPERFGRLQRDFIAASHYEPARDKILARTGVDLDTLPAAAREALWSTSVQHGAGGAARIFTRAIRAMEGGPSGEEFAQELIDTVYDRRKTQFSSSTARVQASVRSRMDTEKQMVLAMLNGEDTTA